MGRCKAKDPIERLKNELKEKWMCSESEIANLEEKAQKVVEEAVAFAENAAEPELSALHEHVFYEEA
jgi:pyruvate dehydrogenase E1 component alpha subunit